MTIDSTEIDRCIMAAQGGDRAAFLAVVDVVEPVLQRTLAACALHPGQIDELVHDACVEGWTHLHQYRPQRTFVAWMQSIALNLLRQRLRSERRRSGLDGLDAEIIDLQLDRLEHDEERDHLVGQLERLHRCLERLPDRVRALVTEHHLRGIPITDIASVVSRSPNWVAVNLFRARRSLALCIQDGTHAA